MKNKLSANQISRHKELVGQAREKYEKLRQLGLKITEDYLSAVRLDVEQLRDLLVQISIVSFGAVGSLKL